MDFALNHNTAASHLLASDIAPPAPKEEARSRKKRKTQNGEAIHGIDKLKPCYLSKMPFELLAEILQFTTSPKDILAVSRCSKFFCATLLNPSSTYIWRHARTVCKPDPLPDPLPTFTESSYAAFVFDGGECEVRVLGSHIFIPYLTGQP